MDGKREKSTWKEKNERKCTNNKKVRQKKVIDRFMLILKESEYYREKLPGPKNASLNLESSTRELITFIYRPEELKCFSEFKDLCCFHRIGNHSLDIHFSFLKYDKVVLCPYFRMLRDSSTAACGLTGNIIGPNLSGNVHDFSFV